MLNEKEMNLCEDKMFAAGGYNMTIVAICLILMSLYD